MYTAGSEHDVIVAGGLAADRYRHVTFVPSRDFAAAPLSRSQYVKPSSVCTCPNGRQTEHSLDPKARRFLRWILGHAGVDLDHYRPAPLGRRLKACLRCVRAKSVEEATRILERQPEKIPLAASALLIGVTQFFREPQVFSYLDSSLLPMLSEDRGGLRIWSAGCADGAELYSVAMLLAEQGLLEGSRLLGTDCRADAIAQARRGWYEAARLESVHEPFRQRHFTPALGGWQVCDLLRQATIWQQADVLAGPSRADGKWDVILCRNLAIYLEPAAVMRLWAKLTESLRVGGILIVGKAEQPERRLRLARLAPCVFERRG